MRDFDAQRKKGIIPVFDPADYADLDIDQAAWKLEPEDAARLAQKRA